MAKLDMVIDDSSFKAGTALMQARIIEARQKALAIVANELLRLSQREVPFVTGELMSSGVAQPNGENEWIVGYNKVYAAYMHEGHWQNGTHVIKHYSNNRKGKYLEDPMKMNREVFRGYFMTTIKAGLGMV